MFRIVPSDINIDFVAKMKVAYVLSAVLVLASLFLFLEGGLVGMAPRWGIDFAGGTEIQVQVDPTIDIAQIRVGLEAVGLSGDSVQRFGADEDHNYLIRVQNVNFGSHDKVALIQAALESAYGKEAWKEFAYNEEQGMFLSAVATEKMDAKEVQGKLAADPSLAEMLGKRAVDPAPPGDDDSAGMDEAEPLGDDDSAVADALDTEAATPTPKEEGNDWVTESLSDENALLIQLPGFLEQVKRQLGSAFGKEHFEVERVESVGPKVGQELRTKGVTALLISLVIILLYIAFRFDLAFAPGAAIALLHDVFITIGVFTVLGIEFNITIIAALLTIVGYSLNDTIVVYDRIRENIRRFKRLDLSTVINRSINETLSRTLMTSITTLIVVVCLVVVGGPIIRPFALALCTGVLVGTYSSVFIASPLILWLQKWLPVDPGKG